MGFQAAGLCGGSRSSSSSRKGLGQPPPTRNTQLHLFNLGGGSPKAPKSDSARDAQAIKACQAALASPRVPSYGLIECEFPPLAALNKLGDGSRQSANQVDNANLSFCLKLTNAIAGPLPFLAPAVWLVTSSNAVGQVYAAASQRKGGNCQFHSLRESGGAPPPVKGRDVCVFCAPSGRDFALAKQLVEQGVRVVLVNAFAKDTKSVSDSATMAYFLKPLTYNSQVAGYLLRSYPGLWTTLDATTSEVLDTSTDDEILVPGTNTPDLRAAVRLVQKAVDQRAIAQRSR